MAPTGWIILAFVTALVMMVIAAMSSPSSRRGVRQFISDLRTRAPRDLSAGDVSRPPGTRWEPLEGDAEGGVRELFQLGEVPESAYVDPPAIPEPIARMTRSLVSRVRS